MFKVAFELLYILWIVTAHPRPMKWQFPNLALNAGLTNKFPLEPYVPVVLLFSAVLALFLAGF
jgi:hypothetical protein